MNKRLVTRSRNRILSGLGLLFTGLLSTSVSAEILMSAEWAHQACQAWNNEEVLTDKLMKSGWIKNDADRGYKGIQLYRTDCGPDSRVEMQITAKDDKAACVYGGTVTTLKVDSGSDYVMHAKTQRWQEMGQGKYGPMRAMLFRRLKFAGPRFEAMKNMGPFKQFLLLTGKVPGDASSCPR